MRVAIIQVCSDDDLSGNLSRAEAGVAEAAERGAGFVSLPENFAYMCREGRRFPCAQWPKGEIVEALREWSARYGVWLLGGTFPEAIPGDDRVFNTSIMMDPTGQEIARYRKIHLFDVSLGADDGDSYRESTHFAPGEELVLAQTDFGPIGLSVCTTCDSLNSTDPSHFKVPAGSWYRAHSLAKQAKTIGRSSSALGPSRAKPMS